MARLSWVVVTCLLLAACSGVLDCNSTDTSASSELSHSTERPRARQRTIAPQSDETATTTPATRRGCSSDEMASLEEYRGRAATALMAGDVDGYLRVVQKLVARLSPECRAELEQSVRASGGAGCTADEQQLILQAGQRATIAAMNGDVQAYIAELQTLGKRLSPQCQAALAEQARAAAGARLGTSGSGGYAMPGRVIDHGGGAYSAPGAYCDSSGCIPM